MTMPEFTAELSLYAASFKSLIHTGSSRDQGLIYPALMTSSECYLACYQYRSAAREACDRAADAGVGQDRCYRRAQQDYNRCMLNCTFHGQTGRFETWYW